MMDRHGAIAAEWALVQVEHKKMLGETSANRVSLTTLASHARHAVAMGGDSEDRYIKSPLLLYILFPISAILL
jgi:hypothetical protein